MKRIHFVGIKGVAMAALAVWYKEAGYSVTGSDVTEEFPTDEVLGIAKIPVLRFNTKNIVTIHPALVIYTGAHGGRENPEVEEAVKQGIDVFPHGKALGMVMAGDIQISVAGSHGKTTTSAMIATVLSHAGLDPSYAIGCGEIRGLGPPGHCGKNDIFVAEADEYSTDPTHDATPRFLWQSPDILVVTNIDFDHPDVFTSLADIQDVFIKFQQKLRGQKCSVINADDPASKVLMQNNCISYGFSAKSEFQVRNVRFGQDQTYFALWERGVEIGEFTLKVPGRHNALNAAAAAIACKQRGLSWEQIAKGLVQFYGTKRRFEYVGEIEDIRVIDDYAHHPNEINATLSAAREWYPHRRIIAVFQPHTYSRTKALMSEFSRAFADAHEVILTDIYSSARETDALGVSGKTLVEETAKHHPNVYFAPDYEAVQKLIAAQMRPKDIIIFMGAGSIYTWGRRLINAYEQIR